MKRTWCKENNSLLCKGFLMEPNEEHCKKLHCQRACPCYNPKMTFFEAWEKAEGSEAVTNGKHVYRKISDYNLRGVSIADLFEKEWTIIPEKKKVTKTIEIPEGATDRRTHQKDGKNYRYHEDDLIKITYEIEE